MPRMCDCYEKTRQEIGPLLFDYENAVSAIKRDKEEIRDLGRLYARMAKAIDSGLATEHPEGITTEIRLQSDRFNLVGSSSSGDIEPTFDNMSSDRLVILLKQLHAHNSQAHRLQDKIKNRGYGHFINACPPLAEARPARPLQAPAKLV